MQKQCSTETFLLDPHIVVEEFWLALLYHIALMHLKMWAFINGQLS